MLFRGLLFALYLFQFSEAIRKPSKGSGLFSGFTSAVVGTVNRYVLDIIDGKGVEERYSDAFGEIRRKLETWTCVEGVVIHIDDPERNLKLFNGNLTEVEKLVITPRVVEEEADSVIFILAFVFPTLPLTYNFEYSDIRLGTHWQRNGHITLAQDGPNIIQFIVQTPKYNKKINEMLSDKNCAATVKGVKTNFGENSLTVKNVDYPSIGRAVGLGFTGRYVTTIVNGLKEDIQQNIKAALRFLVEDSFRNFAFNCKDTSYVQADKAADCQATNTATKYKPQSSK